MTKVLLFSKRAALIIQLELLMELDHMTRSELRLTANPTESVAKPEKC